MSRLERKPTKRKPETHRALERIVPQDDFIQIPLAFVRSEITARAMLLLAALLGKARQLLSGKKLPADGMFFMRTEELLKMFGWMEDTQRRAFNDLRDEGLVRTEMRGMPARRWIQLNVEKIQEMQEAWHASNIAIDKHMESGADTGTTEPAELRGEHPAELRGEHPAELRGEHPAELRGHSISKGITSNSITQDDTIVSSTAQLAVASAPSFDLSTIPERTIELIQSIADNGKFSMPRLPKAGNPPTKALLGISAQINRLSAGTFSRNDLDPEWITQRGIIMPTEPMDWETLTKFLYKAAKRSARAREQGSDGDVPKSISEWFYNPRTKKSRMLYFASRTPRTPDAVEAETHKARLPESVQKIALEIHRQRETGPIPWPDNSWSSYWIAWGRLLKWREERMEICERANPNGAWYQVAGSPAAFARTVRMFILEENGIMFLRPYFLQPDDSPLWKRFTSWVGNSYGAILDPTEADLSAAEKQTTHAEQRARDMRIEAEMARLTRIFDEIGEPVPPQHELAAMAAKSVDTPEPEDDDDDDW